MCLQHDPIAVKGNQSQSHVRACTWPTTLMGAQGDRCDSCGEIKTRLLTWVTRLGGGEEEAKEKEKKKEIKLSALKERLRNRTFMQVYKITHVGSV